MQYDNPFADEVRMNPYDNTPRLIFADYLDDRGDPLGQFIRTQMSLSEMPQNDPSRTALELQESELIREFGETWLAPLRELGAEGVNVRCFQRGLIERIKISARNLLVHGAAACAQSPALHAVQVTQLESAFDDFVSAELPSQIRCLDLSSSGIASWRKNGLRRWSQLRCIEQMTELELQFTKTCDDDVGAICSRDLTRLRKLNLGVNSISSRGAIELANCTSLVGLTHLLMPLNNIARAGAEAIANSSYFAELIELDLSSNSIDSLGVQALAKSVTLRSLQRLGLRANLIADQALLRIEAFGALPRLTNLDVRNNRSK
jgi:uncharacterized protein (TIGR02996 family)